MPGKVLLVSTAAAIVLGWTGWASWAARAADQVSATWSLRCRGTTVGQYQGDPAIHSRPGWTCDVTLQIVNGSGRAVRVTGVEAPLMGTQGAAEVQGRSSPAASIRDADANTASQSQFGDVDAVWDINTTLPAQSSRNVDLVIGWRESGCNSAGYLHIDRWPTIVFEILGRTYRYAPQQRLVLRTYDDSHDATACLQ